MPDTRIPANEQSLAFCPEANRRRRHEQLFALGDIDAYATIPRALRNLWRRTRLPRSLQEFPDPGRRSFFVVARYVERNAVRANLVDRAEDWRWGSLFRWVSQPEPDPKLLSAWPIPRLPNWTRRVNEPLTEKEIAAVRWSLKRGSPFGNEAWVKSTARRLELESTLRPRGRPQVRNLPIKDS